MNESTLYIKEVPTKADYIDYWLMDGDRKIAEFNNKTEAEINLKLRTQRKEVNNGSRR